MQNLHITIVDRLRRLDKYFSRARFL